MSQLFQGLAYKPVFAPSSPPSLLSDSDSVSALAWDSVKQVLAVANGNTVDIGETFGGRTFSIVSSINVGESIVAVSLYDGAMFVATPTKGLYYPDFNVDAPQTISTAGIVDGLLWSTAQDSNPDWPSEVFASYQTEAESATRGPGANFPDLFLIEAIASQVTIYDVSSGVPVMWMVFNAVGNNMLNHVTSVDAVSYTDGILHTGGNAGSCRINFVQDVGDYVFTTDTRRYVGTIAERNDTLGFSTISTETIVNNTVNDVSSTILSSVPTTNELSATEDWEDAFWDNNLNVVLTADTITDDSTDGLHRTQVSTFTIADGPLSLSCDFEYINHKNVALYITDESTGDVTVTFDLVSGVIIDTVTTGASWSGLVGRILPKAGGGYRASLSASKGAGVAVGVSVRMADDAGSLSYIGTGTTVKATNIQLEQSSTPHAYVPSVTGPTTGTTPSAKQLVNRTNLLTHSNDWTDTTNGFNTNVTVTLIPDATYGQISSVTATAASGRAVKFTDAVNVGGDGDSYAVSVWARTSDSGVLVRALNGGSAEIVDTPVIADNVWRRYEVTNTLTAITTSANLDVFLTNDATSVELAQGQLETGTQATPYIATTDSAATVTDDTGLFVPTWAVATGSVNSGGLGSCGLDTGNIIDYNQVGNHSNGVEFLEQGDLLWNFSASSITCRIPVKDADVPTTSTDPDARLFSFSPFGTSPAVLKILQALDGEAFVQGEGLAANATMDDGIGIINDNSPDEADAIYTRITTTYNTGGMKQPDGAWANDTGTDPIGLPFVMNDDFDEPDVTAFIDDFNRTDPAPWVERSSTVTTIGNELVCVTEDANGAGTYLDLNPYCTDGKWYRVRCTITHVSGAVFQMFLASNSGGIETLLGSVSSQSTTNIDHTWQFSDAQDFINYREFSGAPHNGEAKIVGDFLIEEVPALDGWYDPLPLQAGDGRNTAIYTEDGKLVSQVGAGSIVQPLAAKAITTVIGKHYYVPFDFERDGVNGQALVSSSPDVTGAPATNIADLAVTGSYAMSFTATQTEHYIGLRGAKTNTAGARGLFDNVTVQESLVENGTFDSSTTGWTALNTASIAAVSGELEVTSGGNAGGDFGNQPLTLVSGRAYTLTALARAGTSPQAVLKIDGAANAISLSTTSTTNVVLSGSFVADQTTMNIRPGPNSATVGHTAYFDNIIVTEALPDNSGQDNHMQVIGQVTRVEYENTGMYGVCVDDKNYLIGQSSKNVTGRVKYGDGDWTPFNGINDLKYASQGGGTFELRGAAQGTVDYQTCYFDIVAGDAIGGALGGVQYQDGTAFPAFVTRGLPFASSYTLAVDSTNPITYYHQGLPFVASGRIAADLTGPVDRIAPGNVPLSAAGRVVILNTAADHVAAAVIYDTDSAVVGV